MAGRSLIATDDINTSDDILTIPSDVLLIADCDENSDAPPMPYLSADILSDFWAQASWEVRLALILLNHVYAGENSPWYAYITALPKHTNSVLSALTNPKRASRARQQLLQVDLLEDAENYAAHIVVQHGKLIRAINGDLTAAASRIPLQDFVHCVALAQSRAFGLPSSDGPPSKFAMFPYLDCANHSWHSRSELWYRPNSNEYGVSGISAKSGELVHLKYGHHTLTQQVLFYGFVEGNSPYASIVVGPEIIWDAMLENDSESERRQDLLDQLDLGHDLDKFEVDLNEIDIRLMMGLRIAVATSTELDELENMGLDALNPTGFMPIGLDNELRAWQRVITHFELRLVQNQVGELEESFVTKARNEEHFSESCDWGGDNNEAACALLRFERKRVIEATLNRTRQFANMSSKLGRLIDPAILKRTGSTILRTATRPLR